MPAIAKIRFTNVIYEGGAKRYNDDIFNFDGHNGIILLENSGGKTVFIQTAVQAVLPHQELANRKVKDTLMLQGTCAHIAVEWILNDHPRRYALTAVTLYLENDLLQSHRYVYEYESGDPESIENLPFVCPSESGALRPASQGEMADYYQHMAKKSMLAQKFNKISTYHKYMEENFKIIPRQWKRIVDINGAEGDVQGFFKGCATTEQLVNRLLIPTVEEALAGDGAQDFVELFDQQRAHFKEHLRLTKQLEENQGIEKQVQLFVDRYQKLDLAEQEQRQHRQRAKAFYGLHKQVLAENEQQQSELENKLGEIQKQQKTGERQEESLKIRELEQKCADLGLNFVQIKEQYYNYQDRLQDVRQRYQSLDIALTGQKIKERQELGKDLRSQLQQLAQEPTVALLEEQLKVVRQQMKAYFKNKEQQIKAGQAAAEKSLQEEQAVRKKLNWRMTGLERQKGNIIKQLGILDEKIKSAAATMADLKSQVFIGVEPGPVETEIPRLNEQTKRLEQEIKKCMEMLDELDQEKNDLRQKMKQEQANLHQIADDAGSVTERLKNISRQQGQLMNQLKEKNTDFARYHSLYTEKASIMTQVAEKNSQLSNEAENLLRQERLAFRFLDDYQDSAVFTADPLLEQFIQAWRGQFTSLESGTEFIARAKQSLSETYKEPRFPFWPLTVITAEQQKDKLVQKMELQRDKITHPVFVISTGQARAILDGMPIDFTIVEPGVWRHNIDPIQFSSWKEKLQTQAQAAQESRQRQARNRQDWQVLRYNLNNFYRNYPYEEFTRLSARQIQLEEQRELLSKKIKDYQLRLDKAEQKIKALHKKRYNAEQHKAVVLEKLGYAQEYMQQKIKFKRAQKDNYRWEQKRKENKNECHACINKCQPVENAIDELKINIYDFKQQLKALQDDENYMDVHQDTSLLPIDNDLLGPTLLERKKNILAQLNKEQFNRQNITGRLDKCQQEIKELKAELEHKKISAGLDAEGLDVDQPAGAMVLDQEQLIKLAQAEREIKREMEPVTASFNRLERELDQQNTILETRRDDYLKSFHPHSIETFYDPLPLVRERLSQERQALQEQQRDLTAKVAKLNKEYGQWDQLRENLLHKNGEYGFLIDEIEPAILEGQQAANYVYRAQQIWEDLFKQLAASEQRKQKETTVVAAKRRQLLDYCQQRVQDVRMRQDVKTGLTNKDNYADILEWHGLMQNRINRTKNIIENDLKNHNVELEHFVAYLHNYLKQIKEELEQIPKKTRVKVENKWKSIYVFKVPDWPEDEGKESIRRQVFWMLEQLEDAAYKDDYGREDENKASRDIANWLQTKQMLRVVMKNQKITVQCRKVSNDGRVGGGLHGWRESNSWSMGERWSKNMTLFLGVLNYLAEKRQHIHHQVRLTSSVIMDNPFGQASSDHVLDPVFFIAGQLGFQMIALTAHTGGNFIRNYFPIVYSCRLRQAQDSDKLIMAKEKELKKAYFQDHDPKALDRLGAAEQLALF